jgi:repressor LexA
MPNVAYMIPKRVRALWAPELDELELLDIAPMNMAEIPLLGWITAGQPMEISEDNQSVAVPANMVRKNTYALKVRGHSMIDDNIQDGDIVIIEKRETAENGQSVVAMINGEQVTLKKFYIESDGIRLQPANPDMEPILLSHDEVEILGIVTGVIRLPE